MPTYSGTYAFSPALSALVTASFSQIGIKPTEIVVEHMKAAEMQSNLLLCQFSNLQPNLWISDLRTEVLSQGTATYALDAEIVAIQAAYISTTVSGTTTDRTITPISTVEYAAQPNKATQGFPASYWFDRQITPQVTLYPVPDGNLTYTLYLRCVRQVQDAAVVGGKNVEIPYRFFTAFVDGLAHRLGMSFPAAAKEALGPSWRSDLKAQAADSWDIASSQDVEHGTSMHISPQFGGYFR